MARLNTAGRGGIFKAGETSNAIQRARLRRTSFMLDDKATFLDDLRADIVAHAKRADRAGLVPAFRLDGTSDLGLGIAFAREFPAFKFYDYTKNPWRALKAARGVYSENYSVTFSRSESNADACARVLDAGGNVAVVFRGEIPETWNGIATLDGDRHDLRFLDERPRIVALKAKGRAKRDVSGFVVAA